MARTKGFAETSLRSAQKELTRDRVRDAASQLFYSIGYNATTVEQIVAGAGVSRATFYLHFKDKADVLRDIVVAYTPRGIAVMRLLPGPRPTEAQIRTWLREWTQHIADEWVSTNILRYAGYAMRDGFPLDYLDHMVEEGISAFGDRIPAFAAAVKEGPLQAEAKIRSRLIIGQMTTICSQVARSTDEAYRELALEVGTSLFKAFLHDRKFLRG